MMRSSRSLDSLKLEFDEIGIWNRSAKSLIIWWFSLVDSPGSKQHRAVVIESSSSQHHMDFVGSSFLESSDFSSGLGNFRLFCCDVFNLDSFLRLPHESEPLLGDKTTR